jgi:hypothetical protein
MARVVGVIWVCREEVYFCGRGWTGQITLKSLQKINFPRIGNLPVGQKQRSVRTVAEQLDGRQ